MTDQIRAPWTPEQVAALNRFQAEGGMHPFTCGNDHATGALHLVAHEDGWHCWLPDCDYRQDWAHAFMADPGAWPKFPFGERHGPTPEESRAAMLVQVGWYCWRCRAVNRMACRSDNVPVHVPAEWADEMRAEIARREDEDDGDEPTPPQDGPHASQDAPQRPDAGAETPDGAGGRQTGAEPLDETQRDRLAEWLSNNCGEDERSGLLTDDPRKIAAVVLRWPEIAEQPARTTANNGATSRNAADNPLREQIAAALWQAAEFNTIAEWICCEPLNPNHELCAQGYAAMRMIKALIVDDPEAYKPAPLADAVLAVRNRRMEQLAAGRATWKSKAEEIERDRDQLAATHIRDQSALAQIRLHIAAHRPRLQYADPILLGRIEAVLRQVGELEAAGGGEGA